MAYDVFSKNGNILPAADAVMPLANIAYAYGFGVYESIRVVKEKPLFLLQHLERLMASARVIGLEHTFVTATISLWIHELLSHVKSDALNLKILLIGARNTGDAELFIIPLSPLFPDKRLYQRGTSVISIHHERYAPQAKTLNMLPSFLAYRTAKNTGCYDALFINRSGCITEGTRTNFFVLRGRTLISPLKHDILEGVTLLNVIDVAEKNGYDIAHENIPLSKITCYDGAFLTSTSSKIMPLSKIDNVDIKIPEALHELIGHFGKFLDAEVEKA